MIRMKAFEKGMKDFLFLDRRSMTCRLMIS